MSIKVNAKQDFKRMFKNKKRGKLIKQQKEKNKFKNGYKHLFIFILVIFAIDPGFELDTQNYIWVNFI